MPYFQTRAVPYGSIVVKVLSTFIAAVPVAIPTIIIGVNGACSARLKAKGVSVLSALKLKTAAYVSVVCFDKTGTLTASAVRLCLDPVWLTSPSAAAVLLNPINCRGSKGSLHCSLLQATHHHLDRKDVAKRPPCASVCPLHAGLTPFCRYKRCLLSVSDTAFVPFHGLVT